MKKSSYYTNIKYQVTEDTRLLFVGINPSPGTYERGIPFSNNKSFWYLLHEAGIIEEDHETLKDDKKLKLIFLNKFTSYYHLGIMNVINRPTKTVNELKKAEAIPGAARIRAAIEKHKPSIVCFIGKTAYRLFAQSSDAQYGWQDPIGSSKIYVMHFPLHSSARTCVKELKKVARQAGILK